MAEPEAETVPPLPTVTLEEAISMVDAWDPGFGFQLHQIARALRRGLMEDELERDVWERRAGEALRCLDEVRSDRDRAAVERDEAREQTEELTAEMREHERRGFEDDARLGSLRRENDDLRREVDLASLRASVPLSDSCREMMIANGYVLPPLARACLEALDGTAGVTTGWVSREAKTAYCIDRRRARSGAIRYTLVRLKEQGLVAYLDDQKPACWVRTPAGTQALGEKPDAE